MVTAMGTIIIAAEIVGGLCIGWLCEDARQRKMIESPVPESIPTRRVDLG